MPLADALASVRGIVREMSTIVQAINGHGEECSVEHARLASRLSDKLAQSLTILEVTAVSDTADPGIASYLKLILSRLRAEMEGTSTGLIIAAEIAGSLAGQVTPELARYMSALVSACERDIVAWLIAPAER